MLKMRIFVALVLVLAYSSYVLAQGTNCTEVGKGGCQDCVQFPDCGWCAATQMCLTGKTDKTGPEGSFCYKSWHQGAGSCPDCGAFKDCRSCSIWARDCVWCQPPNGAGSCQDLGETVGCPTVTSCPCEELTTCSECTTQSSCNWCTGNAACIRDSDKTSQCNGSRITNGTCPCGIFTTCDACRNGFGCQWCGDTGTCESEAGRPSCQVALNCNAFCQAFGVDCLACNAYQGCSWCSSTNQCVDQDATGCPMISHTCPQCENHEFCGSCTDEPGCVWCENVDAKPRCQATATAKCQKAPSCAGFCAQFSNCGLCNQIGGCSWCDDNGGYCADLEGTCSFYSHGCSPTPFVKPTKCKSFDGGSFVGGMFLVIGLLILGVGGYVFYRWKTGKKILYQELR